MESSDDANTRATVRNADRTRRVSRQRRARMLGLVAVSGMVDIVLLFAFAAAGTVRWHVGALYMAVTGVVVSLFYAALKSGWSERFRDPALTRAQIAASSAIELGFAALFPQLAFYFLSLLFVVFSFGALRLRPRQALLHWALISAAAGFVGHRFHAQMDIPGSSLFEEALVGLCYSSALLRCTFVGLYGSHIRDLLHERNAQLASASAQVTHLANHDELTGALTRRPAWALLHEQARRADGQHAGFCVAMLDIDHFKTINDRYGHAAGDEVLRRFAATARALLRPADAFARYGGEEFLLILDTGNLDAALAAVDRIRSATAALQWDEIDAAFKVTVSGGVAKRAPHEQLDALIQRADRALYDAKHGGRDRVVAARG